MMWAHITECLYWLARTQISLLHYSNFDRVKRSSRLPHLRLSCAARWRSPFTRTALTTSPRCARRGRPAARNPRGPVATCMLPAAPRGQLQRRWGVPPQAEVWYRRGKGSSRTRRHAPHHWEIPAWKAGGLEHMRCQPKATRIMTPRKQLSKRTVTLSRSRPPTNLASPWASRKTP